MNPHISTRTLVVFLLAGLFGLGAFLAYYNKAFPGASIDLRLTRAQAIGKSRDFLKSRGFSLTGYRSAIVFTEERQEIDFLERNVGLARANALFRDTVAVWRWKVRWFRELEETEYSVEYTPDGRLAGFSKTIPAAAPGVRLDEDRARHVAEQFLTGALGLDLSRYHYIERSTEDLPHRLDQTLVWRYDGFSRVKGAEYRVSVDLQGDGVGGFSQWLQIPESWTVAQREVGSRRHLLSQLAYFPITLLYLAVLVVFFWRAHAGGIRWRWSLAMAGISVVVVFLAQLNNLPFAILSYETTESFKAFWSDQFSSMLLVAILSVLFFVPLLATADVVGRLYLGDRPWSSSVFSPPYLFSNGALRQLIAGYSMAFAAVGYVTVFYVVGRSTLGIWSPVEVAIGNDFSSYFPSFSAIYTGLSAAFTEELMFRAAAIVLVYRITKRLWPAVIIAAVIWGFGHTTYPQQPIWIRGAELGIAGIAYGWVFLRYGLLATLVSHFVYDVFVGVTPQLQSGRPGPVVSALFALALPALLWGTLCLFRPHGKARGLFRRTGPSTVGEPAQESSGVAEAAVVVSAFSLWDRRRLGAFLVVAVAVYCVSLLVPQEDFFGSPPPVRLTSRRAAALCDDVRVRLGFDDKGYRSYTVYRDSTESLPDYIVSVFGIQGAKKQFGTYYAYLPEWTTRWYKEKSVPRLEVTIDDQGQLVTFAEVRAEADGGPRLQEEQAKAVARAFLSTIRQKKGENWVCNESDRADLPHRLDYRFTFLDKAFTAGELQRRLFVTVSGDRVTSLSPVSYVVPEEWTRSQELRQKEIRNRAREIVSGFLVAGLFIFFVVHMVLLVKKHFVRRDDIKSSVVWALFLVALPAMLTLLNSLPAFYDGYFSHTAQSISTYRIGAIFGGVTHLIWLPMAAFVAFLLARMILRAWMPEGRDLRFFVDPVRPCRWGSAENRRGVLLGLALTAFSSGVDRASDVCKTLLSKDLFSVSATVTSLNTRHLSEILSLADKVPLMVITGTVVLAVVVTMRHFLNRGWRILAFVAVSLAFVVGSDSLSWHDLSIEWSLDMAGFVVMYVVVTKFVKWNPMAYIVWVWIEFNSNAFADFLRFVPSGSQEFFWPSIVRMAALVAPLIVIFAPGLKSRKAADGPGTGEGEPEQLVTP